MKLLILMALLLSLVACNKSGGGAFEGLEGDPSDPEDQTPDVVQPIVISSYTPLIDPLVLTNDTSSIFGVSVTGNVGTVTYDFLKDNTETLQSSDSAFYNLLGSSLSAGEHEIKIVAHNLRSSAEQVFNVRKNHPTSIVTFSPAVSGVTMNCGTGSQAFSGILNDLDQDNYLVTWELDSLQVNSSTAFTTVTTIFPYSELVYTPDCSRAGSHTIKLKIFDGHETTEKVWSFIVNNPPVAPGSVQITSFVPVTSPVIMTNSSNTTFGVTIADGAGAVTYDFILDNTTTLQSGSASFGSILGSTLTPGYHSLKIKGTNASSTAEKIFNLRKNTAPSITTYTPALTGNNVNCSGGSITLNGSYSDTDLDAVSLSWKVDGVVVSGSTPFVTTASGASNGSLTYTPDCTKVGIHVFEVVLTDGYEQFSQGWTVSVNNPPPPPGNVQILTFTPNTSPTVMTGTTNTTFAVSILDGAGVVNYEFKLDNSTVLQSSTTPYFVLDGSLLSTGTHTVKVKASNSVSYDEKIFSVRRNALPSSVAYSPALSGSSVNCSSGTIVFDTTVIDADYDTITKSWELDGVAILHNPPAVTISSNPNYGRMEYKPDCSSTGPHSMTFKGHDGYESFALTWSFTVVNPAQESIGTTTPSGSSIVALSTDATKSFTARALTGIPPYTFKWTVKRSGFPDVVKLTDSNVTESSLDLSTSTDFAYGNQTVVVTLTDSTTSNDPSSPAEKSWTVYKNQRPQITSVSPAAATKVNSTSAIALSATVSDLQDTFTSSISRGSVVCSTPSVCGLSSVTLPTATGPFSSSFTSGTTFIGDNVFTLNVTDSHGESSSTQFSVSANYFSQKCNDLAPGEICTLAGMPGLGDGLDLTVPSNLGKVRIHPMMMSIHDVGSSPKNIFITDSTLNVVWYWNRKSSPFQLGPYTIAANSMKVILGAPGFSTTISAAASFGNQTTTQLGNFFLNAPTGVTNTTSGSGSSMVTNVYVGESNAGTGRVLRLQFDNSTSSASILTSNNVLGCTSTASTLDLAVDTNSSPNRLYAACNANSRLSMLDLSSGTAFNTTAAGAIAYTYAIANAGTPFTDGTTAAAYTAQTGGIVFDNVDKVLYFTETNTCRLRVLNPAGNATVNLFDTFSVAAGSVKTVAGGASVASGTNNYTWCSTPVGNYATLPTPQYPGNAASTVTQTTQFNAPRGVVPYRLNGVLKGFFVSESGNHRVTFLNQSNASITIGNKPVPAYSSAVIFGLNNSSGAANNNGALLGGKSSTLNTPFDIVVDGGLLLIADNGNSRIRSLIIDDNAAGSPATIPNGIVATALGSIPKAGYNESPTLQAQNAQFNTPQAIKYDSANNRLLISDTANYRIRSLSLSTGVVDTLVGNGTYNDQASQANPLQLNMRGPKDIDVFKYGGSEFILFADSIMGNNGAYNNFIRALNSYGTIEYVLGTDLDPGKTNVVAGIIPVAPTATTITWNGNLGAYNNQPAVVVPINNPTGLGADGASNSIYITSYADHCILKVDGSGIASVFAGLCGTPGATSGSFSTVRFTNPWDIEMDTLYPGNFFVMDAPGSATSLLKYVNTSGTARSILGTIVNPYSVETISLAPGPNFSNAVAVNSSQICFSNGRFTGPATTQFGTQSVVCYARAGSGGLSLYVGNRNSPGLGTPVFRGRQQRDTEDEGSPMGYGGLDEVNNPVQLAGPEGLAFDSSGNLYITESRGHAVRMVKRWY